MKKAFMITLSTELEVSDSWLAHEWDDKMSSIDVLEFLVKESLRLTPYDTASIQQTFGGIRIKE